MVVIISVVAVAVEVVHVHVHSVNTDDQETFCIDSVGSNQTAWTEDVYIGPQVFKMKLDTGADTNCMPLEVFKTLRNYN